MKKEVTEKLYEALAYIVERSDVGSAIIYANDRQEEFHPDEQFSEDKWDKIARKALKVYNKL